MNVQTMQAPMSNAPTQPVTGIPPRLGTPVPGTTGGLPAQGGLSVMNNPMAQQLQSQGRGEDSMLVHMTPGEVNSLQGLAMAHGGSLTINPNTGLPEAGWLGKLLPTILGAALAATGVGAPLAAGIVGLGSTAATGSLKKGLMAGLGAFGGAGLAGAAGLGGSISQNAFGALGSKAGMFGANMGLGATAATPAITGPEAFAMEASKQGAASTTPQFTGGVLSKFGQATRAGLPTTGIGGMIAKQAPMMAGMGLLSNAAYAATPTPQQAPTAAPVSAYKGPYTMAPRPVSFPTVSPDVSRDSSEHLYFPASTQLLDVTGAPATFADGGKVDMDDGSFVLDARTVSEIGNGSSNAGIDALRRIGGHPVSGGGDGVSDSVPASIGGSQEARVARDEVILPAAAVRRIGKGNPKRGADKLYALMDKAHKARKKAERGQDTKLRRGLA